MKMNKAEFDRITSGWTKKDKIVTADELGRMKVQYDLRKLHPNWKITSMPIYCKYDLEVRDENDRIMMYVEVKDRWDYKLKGLKSVFLNIPKFEDAQEIADKWYYANVFQDNEIVYFKPYSMPETGITEGIYDISETTVVQGDKKKQKRLLLNVNDKEAQHPNKLDITLLD